MRSSLAHGRSRDRYEGGAGPAGNAWRADRRGSGHRHGQSALRPSIPQRTRCSPSRRCATSRSRSPWSSPPIRTSPRRPPGSSRSTTRKWPAVLGKGRSDDLAGHLHDVLKSAKFFPDLRHLQGGRDTNVALDFKLRRGDVETASRQPTTPSNKRSRCSRCSACRSTLPCQSPRARRPKRDNPRRVAAHPRSSGATTRACSADRRTGCA